jgi:Caspase domain
MPDTKRKAALVIGVSDAKPLPYLAGAINGARAFTEWATALEYDTKLITDETAPVTLGRLRGEIEEMLPPKKNPIGRLLIYFAGHGLIREAEEGLWLLSDWYNELRAVAVEVLKRRLYKYQIDQIAIFADACRSLPTSIDIADLVADSVLGRGPSLVETMPPIDKFIAAQDGASTFMIPGTNPTEDRCLFSGVLMEALWGTKAAAYSTLRGKVTSQSLGAYLRSEVPRFAARYRRKLNPTVISSFPEGADIYFGDGEPPKVPALPEWPPPTPLDTDRPRADPPPGIGVESGVDVIYRGSTTRGQGYKPPSNYKRGRLLLDQLRDPSRPLSFETQSGFVAEGMPIRSVWTAEGIIAGITGRANWWHVGEDPGLFLTKPAPLLVEFEDGLCAATTGLPQFIASILRDRRGVSAVVYREIHTPDSFADPVEQALAAMENGALRANAKTDLAIELRQGKHLDPVLGVVSAYLYDSIGDIESIRRMAYFYCQHQQPIPYDVALLAQLRGELRAGLLWAEVTAVKGREPRTEAESRFEWSYSPTRAVSGVVGGLWPWMRQGWTFLDDPVDDGTTLVLPAVLDLAQHLTSGRFATMDPVGAQKLARVFGLRQR